MDSIERDHDLAIVILEAIEKIQEFSPSYDSYMKCGLEYFAIHRLLHIIAETMTRLSSSVKSQFADLPWRNIQGFRNIIVHDYIAGIDDKKIWEIVEVEVPQIYAAMLQFVPEWETLKLQRKTDV